MATLEDISIPDAAAAAQSLGVQQDPSKVYRDAVIQDLLGTDYEYALKEGLLNAFSFDPITHEDGLMHILTGDVIENPEDGGKLAIGYHHEPSALTQGTRVDRTHLEGANKDHRKQFKEHLFEPYAARPLIQGESKTLTTKDAEGKVHVTLVKSSMFPKEYDPLTVIRTIVQAYKDRDERQDKFDEKLKVDIAEGVATMVDGKSQMKIRMHLDPVTHKIRTAFPIDIKQGGIMHLSREEALAHLGLDTSLGEADTEYEAYQPPEDGLPTDLGLKARLPEVQAWKRERRQRANELKK